MKLRTIQGGVSDVDTASSVVFARWESRDVERS